MEEMQVFLGLAILVAAVIWGALINPIRLRRAEEEKTKAIKEENRTLVLLNATMREFGESILAHGDLTPEQQERLRKLVS